LDFSRLRTGEIVAGIGGLALFVFLFFDWFSGGAEVSGSVLNGTATLSHPGISGWNALTDLPGFLIILSGVSGIALASLAAAGQRVNIPVRRGAVTATLGVLAVLLILWRMVAGTPTLKIGIFLGLGAAVAIAVGALMALMEDGFEPLVAVAGGRTRAASASAPPAEPVSPPAASPAKSSAGSSRSPTTRRSTTKKSPARSGGSKRPSGSTRSRSTRSNGTKSSSSRSRSTNSKSRSSTSSRSSSSRSSSTRSRSSGSKRSSGGKRSTGGKKK
jgi:hypothetical protein